MGADPYNSSIVKHVKKSVLLWYTPQEMYELVTGIDQYPQFLPWCDRAEVLERHDSGVTARLGLHYMGVRHAFTTRNEHVAGQSVVVQLVDGPFSLLDGTWLFHPLGRPGSEAEACKIEFDLRYAFCQRGARGGGEPGVRPRGQHLRRLFRQTGRAGAWSTLRWSIARCRARWT